MKILFALLSLFFSMALTGCGGGGGGGSADNASDAILSSTAQSEPKQLSGKLAQNYVRGATILTDKLVDGVGNFVRDTGETDAISEESGDYSILGPVGDYLLVTSGGQKQNSAGVWVDAAPMMAPPPEVGQTTTNITPLTTLVAFEPELKQKLNELGGWNADIASPSGVNGSLLRIAKTVETLSSVVGGGDTPLVSDLGSQLKSLGKFATQINVTTEELANPETLKSVAAKSLTEIVSDPTLVATPPTAEQQALLNTALTDAVQAIAETIPDGPVVEVETLAELETAQKSSLESIGVTPGITIPMSLTGSMTFQPVIRKVNLTLSGSTLTLTAEVDQGGANDVKYAWSSSPASFNLVSQQEATAQINNYDRSALGITLRVTDSTGNLSDTATCTWIANPTTCDCMNLAIDECG